MLQESLAVAKSNNDLLRAMRHHQWVSSLITVLFWIGAFAVPFYLYSQYVQPVVTKVYGFPGATTTFGLPTSADIQKLINSYKPGSK
jgi:predicted MFS family arabinose efflux permease